MARLSKETEDWINSLDRQQLLALLDRIQRAIADNMMDIFDDRTTIAELKRLLNREDSRRAIESGRRLYEDA